MSAIFPWVLAISALVAPSPRPNRPKQQDVQVTQGISRACAAVTRADVREALGRNVAPGVEESDGASSSCDYTAGRAIVTISIRRLDEDVDLSRELELLTRAIPEGTLREAREFEAAAFYMDIPGAGRQLHIAAGKHYVMISVLGFGEAPAVAGAVTLLARRALASTPFHR